MKEWEKESRGAHTQMKVYVRCNSFSRQANNGRNAEVNILLASLSLSSTFFIIFLLLLWLQKKKENAAEEEDNKFRNGSGRCRAP